MIGKQSSKQLAASMVILAGLATAQAQSTAIHFEASIDGGATWHDSVSTSPGDAVQVRMRVELLGATAMGLAGLTCQPVVNNWGSGVDVFQPFTFPGVANNGSATTETAYDGRPVRSTPASNTGRIYPYGASGQGAGSASGVLTAHLGPANRLWFAGSNTLAMGASPQLGLAIAQEPPSIALANFSSSTNATVFRFGMQANWPGAVRTVGLGSLYGSQVIWHETDTGINPLVVNSVQVTEATITTVPGPGVASLMLTGCVVAARRRRT